MADSAVAPVEQHEPLVVTDHVAGMEVAVHQRLRHSAGGDVGEALRQRGDQRLEPRSDRHVKARRASRDGSRRPRAKRFGPPVGNPERQQLLRTAHPLDLQSDQQVHHAHKQRQRGVVLILAVDLLEEHARAVVRDQRRHHGGSSGASIRPSWAKNGGTTLSQAAPDEVGSRHRLERFHERICWPGRCAACHARRAPRRPTPGPPRGHRGEPTSGAAGGRAASSGRSTGAASWSAARPPRRGSRRRRRAWSGGSSRATGAVRRPARAAPESRRRHRKPPATTAPARRTAATTRARSRRGCRAPVSRDAAAGLRSRRQPSHRGERRDRLTRRTVASVGPHACCRDAPPTKRGQLRGRKC